MFAHVLKNICFNVSVQLPQEGNQIRESLLGLFMLDAESLFEDVERVLGVLLSQVVALLHVDHGSELLAGSGYDRVLLAEDVPFDFERFFVAGSSAVQVLDVHVNPGELIQAEAESFV